MRKLSLNTSSPADNNVHKEAISATKPKSVLEAFECIVELAENSGLDNNFLEKASTHIKYAARKLKLSIMQVVMLALFIDKSDSRCIRLSELADMTGCRTTKFLRMNNDIDVLEEKRYIRASRSHNSLSYRVPEKVIKALRKNIPYVHEEEPIADTQSFFDRFNTLMKEKNDDEITNEILSTQTHDMLEEIKNTVFARNLRGFNMDDDDELLFIYMAHLFVENNDDNILFSDIENIYDNDEIPVWCKRQLRNRESELFRRQLIENVNENGMARSDAFKLTDYAKNEILAELNLKSAAKSDRGLIKYDTLAEKHLIYNSEESSQIEELSSILSEKRFIEVQKRLEDAGMRKGFCCLFYGAPGTGKTETVYQLARQTGRNIMRVDVDKIKSCWVGESEKNIKVLFDRYRNICRSSELAPILLFNEADAVLGVRLEGASSAVDKMENSLQNIILQEMETLEGIMIATTNLTNNLDKAFERRFLYKIKYNRPSASSRSQIWKIMLPGLSQNDADTLASRFDLSGGEIENIVRKHSVNAILKGSDLIDMPSIIDICEHERISGSSYHRIGYSK